jgi:uncharacterized protein (TIGR03435 family)
LRIVLTLALGSAALAAQSAGLPSFDVAAITANHDGGNKGVIRSLPGGRFTATNVTARDLLDAAYPMAPSSGPLFGGPAWLDTDRFNVIARAPGNVDDKIRAVTKANGAKEKVGAPQTNEASPEQFMIRALLQERFKLALHHETRDQAVYVLTVAKPSGSLGPKLTRSTVDCRTVAGEKTDKACGLKTGPGEVVARGVTMVQIVSTLSQAVHRAVTDHTTLSGPFDVDLTWAPDQAPSGGKGTPSKPSTNVGETSIFTAIQEQLGLKLESGRGPADVLVIDHVEHPPLD